MAERVFDGVPAYFSRAVWDTLDGKVQKDPLQGLHAHQISILRTCACGDN
jgi:hypothetical protein